MILSFRLKVFSLITRYTGYQSYVKIGLSLISAHSLFLIISMVLWQAFSYRFILVSLFLSFVMLITPRIVWKVLHETRKNAIRKKDSPLRILVVGAGDGGNIFINTVKDRKLNFEIVGIVDRDQINLEHLSVPLKF